MIIVALSGPALAYDLVANVRGLFKPYEQMVKRRKVGVENHIRIIIDCLVEQA